MLAAALLMGLCLAGCGEATGGTTAAAERESTSMRVGAERTASAQTSMQPLSGYEANPSLWVSGRVCRSQENHCKILDLRSVTFLRWVTLTEW